VRPLKVEGFFIMDNYKEIWMDVVGYEGLYQVSNLGRVKGLDRLIYFNKVKKSNILNQYLSKNGYYYVTLSKNSKSERKAVHRIVCENFIFNKHNKRVVSHINNIKTDNRIINLEWVSYSENNKKAFLENINKPILGSKRHTSTINENTVLLIREMAKINTRKEICQKLNLGYHLVTCVILRKTWKHI
jgi:hypothetical protein